MSTQAPTPPNQDFGQPNWGPPPQPPKKKHTVRNVILAIVAVIVVASIATSAGGSKTSTPAAPDDNNSVSAPSDNNSSGNSSSSAKKSSTPAGTVLLSVSGSGSKQTQKFTASGDWDLAYTYNCSNMAAVGGQGNFIATPTGDDGVPSFTNSMVNDLGPGKSDVTHYHNGGTYFLDINSECKWTVKVTTA